jgi:hypothetical protein
MTRPTPGGRPSRPRSPFLRLAESKAVSRRSVTGRPVRAFHRTCGTADRRKRGCRKCVRLMISARDIPAKSPDPATSIAARDDGQDVGWTRRQQNQPQIRLCRWQPSCPQRMRARQARIGSVPLPVLPLRRGPAYRRDPRLPVLPVRRMRRNLDGDTRPADRAPAGTAANHALSAPRCADSIVFSCADL